MVGALLCVFVFQFLGGSQCNYVSFWNKNRGVYITLSKVDEGILGLSLADSQDKSTHHKT